VAALRFCGATFGRAGRRVARAAKAEGSNNRARFPGTFGILRFLVIVDRWSTRASKGPPGTRSKVIRRSLESGHLEPTARRSVKRRGRLCQDARHIKFRLPSTRSWIRSHGYQLRGREESVTRPSGARSGATGAISGLSFAKTPARRTGVDPALILSQSQLDDHPVPRHVSGRRAS